MASGKRFSTQMGGYNKEDVNEYIDAMVEAFKNRLSEKEKTIAELKKQLKEATLELEEAKLKLEVKEEISDSLEETEEFLQTGQAEEAVPDTMDDVHIEEPVESVYYINDNENQAAPSIDADYDSSHWNDNSELHIENQKLMKENEALKEELGLISEKQKEISALKEEMINEKNKVAQALYLADESAHTIIFNAETKAASIVQKAELDAEEERRKNEQFIEGEREKIVDIKRDLRNMRSTFSVLLRKYENEMESVMESNDWNK